MLKLFDHDESLSNYDIMAESANNHNHNGGCSHNLPMASSEPSVVLKLKPKGISF